jgi:hypothetical protein
VWCYWHPTPTIQTRWNHSTSRLILTCRGTAWCGMCVLNFSSTVPCVPQAPKWPGYSASHKEVSLVYFSCKFSTFEPIDLTQDSIMQQAGVPMLYDSASNLRLPCLYICPVANAPLIPCFISGNSHPTIPHSFKDDWRLGSASADTQRDRGNGY